MEATKKQTLATVRPRGEVAFGVTRKVKTGCGGTVEHADGCVVCRGCGYSEC